MSICPPRRQQRHLGGRRGSISQLCSAPALLQPGGRSLSHRVEVGGLPLLGNFTSKPIVRRQQPLLPANPPQKGTRQAGGGSGSERLVSGSVNSQQAISVPSGKVRILHRTMNYAGNRAACCNGINGPFWVSAGVCKAHTSVLLTTQDTGDDNSTCSMTCRTLLQKCPPTNKLLLK